MEFQRIGKYEIVGKVGQGGMGEVFKANDPVLARFVAIKTISAHLATDTETRKRFHREAQSAARLNHPNIITVFDFGEEQGVIYMAMELLEGTDLRQVILNRSMLWLPEKLGIMEQICDGLAFAHAMDVVHRDLKPGNIHILNNGQVKIMDFGLARFGAGVSDITRSGMVMGTPHYMSPEQVRGEKADSRSDIFSLGAVFYELLCNHKPFDADSMHAVLFQVLQGEPEPVRHWVPDMPDVLAALVDKALAKDPAERFQNAGEMLEAVRVVRRDLAAAGIAEPTSYMPSQESDATVGGEYTPTPQFAPRPSSPLSRTPAPMSRTPSPISRAITTPPSPRRTSGAVALDPASLGGMRTPRPAPSAPGSASSTPVPGAVQTSPGPPQRSRLPLYLGGALGLVAVGVVTVLVLRPAGKGGAGGSGQVNAVTEALVLTQLELARKNLEFKDFQGAVTQAERALKLDANNAEARQIVEKAQETLRDLDTAASEARAAFDRGDADAASQALSKVLSLDPKHPVAADLSGKLNGHFRGLADEARQALRRSQVSADRAKAGSLESYAEAAALSREAEALFKRSEYAVATRKFLESRDSFDRARRTAEERAAARTPAPPPASVRVAETTTLPPATTPATLPPPATAPPVTAPPSTVALSTPVPVTVAPVPVTTPANDEPAIRRVIGDYARAIESKDLALFRTLKPNLSPDEERRLADAFKGIQSQQVNITIVSIQMAGSQATVRLSRKDVINGNGISPFQQTFVLTKGPGGWSIRDIGK